MGDSAGAAGGIESGFLLGIDTCGPSGSVALGKLIAAEASAQVEILGQSELAGRSYSALLVSSVADLLQKAALRLADLAAIVVVSGPGSFTGVRVGLSAAKGLAEFHSIPIIALSRLEVLATKSSVSAAALDAHRHEVFLRLAKPGEPPRELLAGAPELAALGLGLGLGPWSIAVCDEPAAKLLGSLWPSCHLIRVAPPTAADALTVAAQPARAGSFADLSLLDGHYLRRSDAEIFGDPATASQPRQP
jgi:tRNA threonylcarbamoyladenosine biosynthesis protein TsaB